MSAEWELGREFVLRHPGMPFDWIEELGDDAELEAALERDDPGYRAAYWAAYRRFETRLHELAADPRVCEAVFVSNPAMWENMWRRYLARAERGVSSAQRRVHRQVYTYLQRLCAKNETTSFFGPLGYGSVETGQPAGCVLHTDNPVRRMVFFTRWAVQALVRAMRRDRELLAQLPVVVLDRDRLAASIDPAGALFATLTAHRAQPLGRIAELLGVRTGAVLRGLRGALAANAAELGPGARDDRQDAFERLRSAVAALGAHPAVQCWLAELALLDEIRTELAGTAFPARTAVFYRLEEEFTRITGQPARRAGGMYTDRFVIYEESSSPFRLELGDRVAEAIRGSLAEALELSADYGGQVRREHQRRVLACWPDTDRLTFDEYGERVRPDTEPNGEFDPHPALAVPARDLLDPARRRELLPAAGPGPRYALPDVCLAAPDLDALCAGRFDVVVARVHHHLLLESWLSVAHPDPARFAAPAARWIAEHGTPGGLLGVEVSRRNKGFYVYPGDRVALRPWRAGDADDPRLAPSSQFQVVRDGQRLRLVGADGRERVLYLPLADLVSYPPLAALAAPPVLHATIEPAGAAHLPRIAVGAAVYQRSRWFVEMPVLAGQQPADRYRTVRALCRQRGLPRFVYLRTRRRKPYLLDTRSPLGVELLAHVTEPGQRVQFEEMAPGPGELWLRDGQGRRYTCELRIQVVRRS